MKGDNLSKICVTSFIKSPKTCFKTDETPDINVDCFETIFQVLRECNQNLCKTFNVKLSRGENCVAHL